MCPSREAAVASAMRFSSAVTCEQGDGCGACAILGPLHSEQHRMILGALEAAGVAALIGGRVSKTAR